MADLPQQNTFVQYLADGITSVYIVPFYTPLEPDGTPNLDVFTQLSTAPPIPEDDIKEWNVDYTYTPNLDPISGGVITFLPGHIPPNGYVVTIVRDVSASLDVEFSQAQTFSGFTLDAALDKLLLISQQNKTYAFQRNLSYIVNAYIPESEVQANVQIPVLGDGEVWFGSGGGVIAAFLQQPADVSTLRSELANEAPVTNGAGLVGYYDVVNSNPTTVADQLTYLTGFVLQNTPTGVLLDFAGSSVPAGFLLCNGDEVSRATYSALFAVIGITWGAGNGTTTFNLPDFRRRVSMGSGGVGTGVIGNAVGNTSTDETTALSSVNQLPAHNHGAYQGQNFWTNNPAGGIHFTNAGSFNINIAGITADAGSPTPDPFNIVQASAIVTKIIKT